jgi:predicted secreted hydrolase
VALACGLAVFVAGMSSAAQGIAIASVGSARTPRALDRSTSDGVAASQSQLWRMSGRLVALGGRAFSYSATFYRYAEPHGIVLIPASVAVLEESNQRMFSERRTEREDFGLARAATGALDVRVGTWRLHESRTASGAPAFALDVRLAGVVLRARCIARKPRFTFRSRTALQDEYSSLASTGTIEIDGRSEPVSGKSWLDHERSLVTGAAEPVEQVRVQLDDGREVYVETSSSATKMLSRRIAYIVESDGAVEALEPAAYEFGENSAWRSPHTRTMYVDGWNLHVDHKTEFLLLEPVRYDQESLAHGDGVSYWDGAVDVFDVTPGSQGLRLGSGYVLMRGFRVEHTKA